MKMVLSRKIRSVVTRVVCFLLAVVSVLTVNLGAIGTQSWAIAAPVDSNDVELPNPSDALDRSVGEGTMDQIQGNAQETLGDVKRNVGKVTGQVEGATEQLQGRAQEDLGRTKQAVDEASDAMSEAGNTAKDKADKLADSVKGFFKK